MKNGRRGQKMKPFAKQTTGQALVEFALVVLILLYLVIGSMEYSRLFMMFNIVTTASREAARAGAVADNTGSPEAAGEARGNDFFNSAGYPTGHVDVRLSGGIVTADATYDFPVSMPGFLPGLSGPTRQIQRTTTMRKE